MTSCINVCTYVITVFKMHKTSTTKKSFRNLMLKFPQSHHESDQARTLEELISLHNAPDDIHQYQCDSCNMRTCARQHSIISKYPKILCIVLPHKKSNETKIKLAVQYPLHGLFGSVHHKANRGKSGHYIPICEHQDSNNWFSYDDHDVRCVQFVNKKMERC
jgi:ubiquitin C-terminal hydrolase